MGQAKEGIDDVRTLVEARMGQRGCADMDILPVMRAFQDVFVPMARFSRSPPTLTMAVHYSF